MEPMNHFEREKVLDNLKRSKAYSDEAIEMLGGDQARGFRNAVKEAKDSLDRALAAFTSSEDRRQSS